MTAKAAKQSALSLLHSKLAEHMHDALDAIKATNAALQANYDAQIATAPDKEARDLILPPIVLEPSAALFNSISKFLKDNEITVAPEDNEDIASLERALAEKRNEKKFTPRTDLSRSPLDLDDLPLSELPN